MRKIIFGPPGTGKTTYLLNIVEKEIKENKVFPNKIGYFAFTNQAADEALSRALQNFNYNSKDFIYFRTLHSLAFQQLHLREENVMSDDDYDYVSKKLGIKLSNPNARVENYGVSFPDDVFTKVIDGAKVRGLTTEHYFGFAEVGHLEGGRQKLEYIDKSIQDYKKSRNKYDFTDMIVGFNKKSEDYIPQFDVVIIDEAQDLSWLQWKMVEKIVSNAKRVYIAGDDDQAIFKFCGARPEFLINMEGERVILNKSYRLSRLIHQKANKLIRRVKDRVPKKWIGREDDGEIKFFPELQSSKLKQGEWLLLARDKYILDKLEIDLKSDGVFYARGDRTSLDKRIQSAIIAWERVRKGKPISYKEAKNLYVYIKTGTGVDKEHKAMKGADKEKMYIFEELSTDHGLKVDKELQWMKALENIKPEKRIYIQNILRKGEKITKEPRVRLSTIHGAKGGEVDNVMLFSDLGRKADEEYWRHRDSERRVFYVGMTRARHSLNIVRSRSDREFTEAF